MKIIFFGSGMYTVPIIEVLKRHNLALVVTTENETDPGEKQKTFADYLKAQQIPFISSNLEKTEDVEKIKLTKPDVGILASYGVIVPNFVINACKLGIINIHPSLLPIYRGPSPIQSAILNGDKSTGVSIIKLDNDVDHGPIISQKELLLTGHETTESLKDKLFMIGAKLIDNLLEEVEKGSPLISQVQDHSHATFTQKIKRNGGRIDINKPPDPKLLALMIRAYYPWPGVWFETELIGKHRRIKLLPDRKIQVEGSNIASIKDFVNGYQNEGKKLMQSLGFLG